MRVQAYPKKLYLYEGQHGSTYKSASELYYEKIGQKFKMKESSNAAVLTIGHLEEPSIRKIFKEMYQKDHPLSVITVENDTMLYQCGLKDKEESFYCHLCFAIWMGQLQLME